MYCNKCGKNLNQSEKFCSNCGEKVEIQDIVIDSIQNVDTQNINQINIDDLENIKKENNSNLIIGIIISIVGILLTLGTFFFFGPFLGFFFLIPGTILIFNTLFYKYKKGMRLLFTILTSLVTWIIVIIIAVFIWTK